MSNICGVSEGLSGGPWSPLFPKEHLFIDDNRRRPYSTAALSGRAFPSPSLRLSVPVCVFVCVFVCPCLSFCMYLAVSACSIKSY